MTTQINKLGDLKGVLSPNGLITLCVKGDRVNDYVQFAKLNRVTHIWLTSHLGPLQLRDCAFLESLPDVEHVSIDDGVEPLQDISGLFSLTNLRSLGLHNVPHGFALDQFPLLTEYRGPWSRYLSGLPNCNRLEVLLLTHIGSKIKTIEQLELPNGLVELDLRISSMVSLEGLDNLKRLKVLALYRFSKLTDISAISGLAKSLVALELSDCIRIHDFQAIERLKHLKKLIISRCKEMQSLSFVRGLTNLEMMTFLKTTVLDGDLSPLLSLSKLEHVGFVDNRNYSHTEEQVLRLLKR